jgi:hypothetical protein
MLKVFQEADKVILDLCGRKRDVILSPLDAERLADTLDEHAALAQAYPTQLVKMDVWNCYVTNRDRLVVMRLTPPAGVTCERMPMPHKAARAIADLLRTNADFAGHGLRIETAVGV